MIGNAVPHQEVEIPLLLNDQEMEAVAGGVAAGGMGLPAIVGTIRQICGAIALAGSIIDALS